MARFRRRNNRPQLPFACNLALDTWKVRLIEDDFYQLMFEADETGRRGEW